MSAKLSRRMEEALRAMKETGARIIWDGWNRWLLPDGSRPFWIGRNIHCPSVTVSDALERRFMIEVSRPAQFGFKAVYTITEKGKQAV